MVDDIAIPASVKRLALQTIVADRPLAEATVEDLRGYIAGLGDLAPATISLAVSAVRSLFAFGRVTGVLSNTPGATLRAPSVTRVRTERIVYEAGVRCTTIGERDA